MKKLLIIMALATTFIACNSSTNNKEVADDTTVAGENISADAQQSSVDTNVNKIGTDQAVKDTTKR